MSSVANLESFTSIQLDQNSTQGHVVSVTSVLVDPCQAYKHVGLQDFQTERLLIKYEMQPLALRHFAVLLARAQPILIENILKILCFQVFTSENNVFHHFQCFVLTLGYRHLYNWLALQLQR